MAERMQGPEALCSGPTLGLSMGERASHKPGGDGALQAILLAEEASVLLWAGI